MKKTKSFITNYPRPQLVRKKWVDLNGYWNFYTGDENKSQGFVSNEKIKVPFAPETSSSGINRKDLGNTIWYSKDIIINKHDCILIHFEGSDYETSVFVNGIHVGTNIGGYHRFSFDITNAVKDGVNNITVRVIDSLSCNQTRGKQRWKDEIYGCWYIPTSGIWKSVWIEYVPKTYIKSLTITPSLKEECVYVGVSINKNENFNLKVVASDGSHIYKSEKSFEKVTWMNESNRDKELKIIIPNPKLWDVDNPFLYDLEIELTDSYGNKDYVYSYFAIREIKVDGNKIFMNGQPLYLRMVLDQGYWHESGLTPPSEEALIKDIELTKAMGFNGVRKHQKIEDERYFYYADVLGLYVWCEMPSVYAFNHEAKHNLVSEWQKIVHQYYSHPSLITWVVMNESWGVGQVLYDKEQQKFVDSLYNLTKSYDPHRPVISNDGWEHTTSDLLTIHCYEQNADVFDKNYDFEQTTIESPLCNRPPFAKGYSYLGQPILFTEYGGTAFRYETDEINWGYGEAVLSDEEYIERLTKLTRMLENKDFVSGYCYTQLTDVQQEVNGLLTIDRRPKVPIEKINKIFKGKD
jgi:beta-galactosidase/beta-glucuronidase